ncbi:MAG: hypothetical protein OXN44_05135 [Acidimicrobiaceae bacterium]|nr:hypothetical protein [Acidimicrobiaceae bacterium]
MSVLPVTDTDSDMDAQPLTLADLDASVGSIPDVPENEVAARYYNDEEFLTALRLRRNNRNPS